MFSNLYKIKYLLNRISFLFLKFKLSFGHGLLNAYDEAVYLTFYVLKLPIKDLYLFINFKLKEKDITNIINIISKRIIYRIPSFYITKEAWIKNYCFYIDYRVIIPRSPIGEIIIKGIEKYFSLYFVKNIRRVLDLCTGSGCLAIIVAHIFPNAIIDAVDLSKKALDVAYYNIRKYKLEKKIFLFHGDLYKPLKCGKSYDLIISNPPYVDKKILKYLPVEYKYEPIISLNGGMNGSEIINRIINDIDIWLNKNGLLLIEVGKKNILFRRKDIILIKITINNCNIYLFKKNI